MIDLDGVTVAFETSCPSPESASGSKTGVLTVVGLRLWEGDAAADDRHRGRARRYNPRSHHP